MRMRSERLTWTQAFGGLAEGEATAGRSLQRVTVNEGALAKLFSHWVAAEQKNLPWLKGLTASPSEGSRVVFGLLLDLGGNGPLVSLELDWSPSKALPDFTKVWPHAGWWQEELTIFSDMQFEAKQTPEAIAWRRA